MKPSIGRIVIYTGKEAEVNTQKQCPAVVVAVWSDTCVNLRLLTDSSDAPPWVTSVTEGTGERSWKWPERV